MTRLAWSRRAPAFDLNLMLERIRPEYLRAAMRNVLIPNPEYFRPEDRAALKDMNAVWVKTRHAAHLFEALGVETHFIGFDSEDRQRLDVPRKHAFFHGPGRSGNKGTQALLRLWAKHPEWPMLNVVWRRKRVNLDTVPPNVTLLREHISDDDYRRMQNEHRFHLCPSQTEGYGHYIAEAMSCGAVVITLDAAPMNELVTPERGVLVAARQGGTQDLATLYAFDDASMEAAIEHCLSMDEQTTAALGQAARQWFEDNRASFPARLQEALVALN
ncbi:glycosyltransferase involved in cell wall biosynthesis [Luteibacter sp. Sphag1AF]|uniref:glycosyltransferase n=1 Tax=Luteibacter sp. Sphag1AF TaxID=2587031 RepID=UPI0016191F26|nr:glycosyltransferase [Luteibacter sp. Sphag1AF]MBB3226412.1 glycosyltransferase involved in cell wall biosynthesis [Luteibacter sp. Sphag1AF]